ncbi:hypothetical protein [Nostoc sp.]|uniref:hypothetical protein n=1 Tax=Nostoc sp. TaxID=1180 RepID=UPI002FFC3980
MYLATISRKPYCTDLNDSEWAILAAVIPLAKSGGHPRTTDMREVCKNQFTRTFHVALFTPKNT